MNIKVEIDLSDRTEKTLNRFIDLYEAATALVKVAKLKKDPADHPSGAVAEPSAEKVDVAVPKNSKPAKTPKPAKVKIIADRPVVVSEETKADQSTPEPGAGGKAVTKDDLVTKIVALRDGGKKEQTLKLMQSYNLVKISELPVEKYAEFMDQLNQIGK